MNTYELFERIFCITMLFVSLYYIQELPSLEMVMKHQQEKQSNKEKFNATMRELASKPVKREILYDKERQVIYVDPQTNFIFASQLNATRVMRIFREMMHF